ncbi:golgin candidate 4-like isoform X1 [Humulus lupulus]|uniref:golgin candidate 4-like isoform X1 n=1 Tax=Humulus lupulus TaxID=3486 RepID=UPI002B406AB5|nr:golgin candidate 4-like isoform X1 [Humulus lupulus]
MWSSIENLKENLNKIAQDVHDDEDDDELEIYGVNGGEASPVFDRRNSHSFAHSKSTSRSPLANGIDSPTASPEIDQYKSEIKRLQESEAEIKALSINYAALLKEKEDQISRLNKENGSLKHNLESTAAALNVSRNESHKVSTNGANFLKENSPNRQHKFTSQAKNRHSGNQVNNGVVSKQDGMNNGITNEEFADLLEEKNRSSAAAVQATAEIRQLRLELERERDHHSDLQLKLEEEKKLNESFREELKLLKMEKDKSSLKSNKVQDELNEKISVVKRLQMELNRREAEGANDIVENLKRSIATLEKENASLKMEKNELKATREMSRTPIDEKSLKVESSASFTGKEEMELSLQKLDGEIKEAQRKRDKAIQELTRLKQHLLEKESEESEKMDEDSKIIEELRETNERQRAHILYLEKTLKQAMANHEEVKVTTNNEIQKSKELIDDLNKKLTNCMSTIEAKNIELINLQTALGQYYAEIEAKEHLEGDLAHAREEVAKLSELLKNADIQAEVSKRENDEILSTLLQAERNLTDWKGRVNKLEEDNAKLRRALEQSMTRLNRMSVDSDFLVDRRIVIKLLVTYFQRNYSKEVLDLMVRMLGFTDEDKQRIGVAQQGGGQGVVRGVLGLPGRLVGGILGGGSGQVPANAATDNQSFADLWVDFLLKESEERERREAMDAAASSGQDKEELHRSTNMAENMSPPKPDNRTNSFSTASGFSRTSLFPSQNNTSPFPYRGNSGNSEHSDSEFSTVPLSSSESNFQSNRLLNRY